MRDYAGHNVQLGDYDRDVALTVTQFVLSPDVPPQERKYFEKYYLMFSKTMALGNIKNWYILAILISFDEICMLLEMGLYEESRQLMAREIMKMQCSRSVDGFQTLFGSAGIQRTETISRILRQRNKSGFGGRLGRLFGGGKEEEYESSMPMGNE